MDVIQFIANELNDMKILNVPQPTQRECFKPRSQAQCLHQAFQPRFIFIFK